MDKDQGDKICALCKWNKVVKNNFFCGHINQKNAKLKRETKYNDSCKLFVENEDRKTLYDFWDQEFLS